MCLAAHAPSHPAAHALFPPGHGESGRSLGYRYGADALAEDVKALIVALVRRLGCHRAAWASVVAPVVRPGGVPPRLPSCRPPPRPPSHGPPAPSMLLQDLYVQPVALVGCGMGAAAALVLAQRSPFLAGAVLAGEFALPVAALQEEAGSAGNGSSNGVSAGSAGPAPAQGCKEPPQQAAQLSSTQLMPWWGFRAGQASAFDSVEQCAALLAHPLANLSPQLLVPLAQAAQAAAAEAAAGAPAGDAAAPVRQLLAQLGRPLQGAVASACSLLRVPERGAASRWEEEEEDEGLHPRTDPAFLFSFDPAAVLAGLPDLRCHLRLLHGGRGSWVEPADAAAMAALAAQGGAASASVAQLPSAGHWLAADQPEELLKQIVAFLEGPAIRCFSAPPAGRVAGSSRSGSTSPDGHGAPAVGAAVRRPELLDLKPLPQYASLEEAKKVS